MAGAVTDMAFINEKSMLKEKNSLSLIAQRKDYRTIVFGEYWKITTVTYGSVPNNGTLLLSPGRESFH